MNYPNFNEEKKLRQQGYKMVTGIDEAGRGPLAGPVVAAAVIVQNLKFQILNFKSNPNFKNIKDSKKMTAKQRENAYDFLTKHPDIVFGVGIVSEKVIDKINILQATKLAMLKSVKKLNPDFLLLDGNFKINCKINQKSIIKGDTKVISIAMASIIAKVTRDKIMKKYHKKYFDYGFDKHKGYGTKVHYANLEKFGPCKIHRKTFCLSLTKITQP
ncbi:MAG: ribonuclease HII [Candidatus Shapirobacteria bacterium]|jgi:ribonuclease HII